MSRLNQSQLAKDLTDKEARSLRSSLADVAHKKAKIKGKKSKLSADDELKLQRNLDDISDTIVKKKLHPEVQAKATAKELESKKAAAAGKEKARAEDLAKAQSKNKDKATNTK